MNHFEYQLTQRCLLLRQRINRFAQCCNFAAMRIKDELSAPSEALHQSRLELETSTARLARCLDGHGL